MERNYASEIDQLRGELEEIKELIMERLMKDMPVKDIPVGEAIGKVGHVDKMANMHPDSAIVKLLGDAEDKCGECGNTGRVTYLGVFASGGRQSTWIKKNVNADDLLGLIENRMAEKVLACIGNGDRLNLLRAILIKPMTVAEMVEECGFGSTGQVYHHLKPLIAADIVCENSGKKGVYHVVPHRVQGIIMLLAGISDMCDPEYTNGTFDE